jgi:hypothetical protein
MEVALAGEVPDHNRPDMHRFPVAKFIPIAVHTAEELGYADHSPTFDFVLVRGVIR